MSTSKKTVQFKTTKNETLTDAERERIILASEAQLVRSRRRYTLLRTQKISHAAVSILHKQRRVLNVLRAEYNEIATDANVVGSAENAAVDTRNCQILQNLLTEHQKFSADVKSEKDYLNELDTQITITRRNILAMKRMIPNYYQESVKIKQDYSTLETLENKLECATKRFCVVVVENRKLRLEIKHLLYERSRFKRIWDRLLQALADARKYMIDLIQMATMAYDQREEWMHKLEVLRRKAQSDFVFQAAQLSRIGREMNERMNLQAYYTTKCQKRVMKKAMEMEYERRQQQKEEMTEMIEKYTEIMNNIKEFTEEECPLKIMQKYLEREEQNYTKFKLVVSLNSEVEILNDELLRIYEEMQEVQDKIEKSRNEEEIEVQELEKELFEVKIKADEAEQELSNTELDFIDILKGVQNIFNELKTYNPLTQLLGNNFAVNEHNILMFVNLIEQRFQEITVNVSYREKLRALEQPKAPQIVLDKHVTYHHGTVNEWVSKAPCPLCMEKAMVTDVIESLQRVMDRDDIEAYLGNIRKQQLYGELIHNVSGCQLPKARAIMQACYS